jgi:hypothetical protein
MTEPALQAVIERITTAAEITQARAYLVDWAAEAWQQYPPGHPYAPAVRYTINVAQQAITDRAILLGLEAP